MRLLRTLLTAFFLAAAFAATADDATNKPAANSDEVAVIDTTDGQMVIAFWPDVAPKTVANFKKLAKEGYFNGTAFHRIIQGFMIQGGDPLTKDQANAARFGTGGPGYTIDDEFNDHPHVRGVISMANTGMPHSAGSQFFICLGPAPFLNHHYTAFGHVIKGDDVLGKIGDTPVQQSRQGEMSEPTTRVEIKSVKIVPANDVK